MRPRNSYFRRLAADLVESEAALERAAAANERTRARLDSLDDAFEVIPPPDDAPIDRWLA